MWALQSNKQKMEENERNLNIQKYRQYLLMKTADSHVSGQQQLRKNNTGESGQIKWSLLEIPLETKEGLPFVSDKMADWIN